jgi:hypothetical protein
VATSQPAWVSSPAGTATNNPTNGSSNPATYPRAQEVLPPQLPELEAVAVAVAQHDGNLYDAALSLHIDHTTLLRILTENPSSPALLAQTMRLFTTLRTYEMLETTRRHLSDKIDDMAPKDLSTLFSSLMTTVATLTDKHEATQNINVTEVVLRMLPPQARVALQQLAAEQGD